MSNHRNESVITLAGRSLILRPSFEELERLEEYLPCGILEYLGQLAETNGKGFKLGHLVRVLHCGARGGMSDSAPSYKEMGDLVLSEGLPESMALAVDFMKSAVLRADSEENVTEGQQAGK